MKRIMLIFALLATQHIFAAPSAGKIWRILRSCVCVGSGIVNLSNYRLHTNLIDNSKVFGRKLGLLKSKPAGNTTRSGAVYNTGEFAFPTFAAIGADTGWQKASVVFSLFWIVDGTLEVVDELRTWNEEEKESA